MVKRSVDLQVLPSPGLKDAPVLDLMCSHFVLTLAAKQGGKFNVRRDLNGLLSLAGRHLAWPAPALGRLREFLGRRCKDNEFWRGHEQLDTGEFLDRHGVWRGLLRQRSDMQPTHCHKTAFGPVVIGDFIGAIRRSDIGLDDDQIGRIVPIERLNVFISDAHLIACVQITRQCGQS